MSDLNSLANIRIGDRDAFHLLMDEYCRAVTMFAFRIVNDMQAAEEIAQDVFVSLWINRRKVDFDTPVRNYLYVSARNLAYNYLRDRKRSANRMKTIVPSEDDSDMMMVLEEAYRLLDNAIAELPPRTGQIIRMSMSGMKRHEIADALGVSESNVKHLKSMGVRKLRRLLGNKLFVFLSAMFYL